MAYRAFNAMTVVNSDKLRAQLTEEEGEVSVVYKDSLGNLTGGVGHKLLPEDLATYGLGDTIPQMQIDTWFDNDIAGVQIELAVRIPWVFNLDEVRLRVFYDLCFNMGIGTLLEFKNMLMHAQAGDWGSAANDLINSSWDEQVGTRAAKLEGMIRTGVDA
jgi:lysozyme